MTVPATAAGGYDECNRGEGSSRNVGRAPGVDRSVDAHELAIVNSCRIVISILYSYILYFDH